MLWLTYVSFHAWLFSMTQYFDIFNGDADGIIALLQLRLNHPRDGVLISGVKRDISLLQQVDARKGDMVIALDISLEKNRPALERLLEDGVHVLYIDHHRFGEELHHPFLTTHIDLDPDTCTSLIVDGLLESKYHYWAITAAYGDNLLAKANQLAHSAGLTREQALFLQELGTLINYNGYGESVSDLHFPPIILFQSLLSYPSPFDLLVDLNSPYYQLKAAYDDDFLNACAQKPLYESEILTVYFLPDQPWARRISGVFGNHLANVRPRKAHVVLTDNRDGTVLVSLRAPLENKQGAGDICSTFHTGGGRAAAAGINRLEISSLANFYNAVEAFYMNNEHRNKVAM